MKNLIPRQETIVHKIYLIRGRKVMLDRDLARLYGVLTKVLNQGVKRNMARFPDDFMFQLSQEEFENWKSQFVTSNSDKMGLRRPPYAFTDYGILMLSSVLKSQRAIQVNVAIMRVFVRLRELLLTHKDLALRLMKLEQVVKGHGEQIHAVFDIVSQLMIEKEKPRRQIGFHP